MQSVARKPWQTMFVLFAVFSIAGVTLPRKAQAQAGPQPITGCTRIIQPGSYVVVNNIKAVANLTQTDWGIPGCLVIAADFVTLDLGGFTLFGPGNGVYAVGVITGSYGYRGATVRSGEVTNFFIGVYLGSQIGSKGGGYVLEHVTAIGNSSTGIEVYTDGARLVGNVAISNGGQGFLILCPAVVAQNMAISNSSGEIVESGSTCTNSENNPAP